MSFGFRRATRVMPWLLAAGLASSGLSCLFDPVDLGTHADFPAEFQLVWQTADRFCPGFAFSGLDWDAAFDEYSPMMDTVTTQLRAMELMAEMFGPMEDEGIIFYESKPGGECIRTYTEEIDFNFNGDVLWQYLEPQGFEYFQPYPIDYWGGCMFDSVAYVMIDFWGYEMSMLTLDEFLAEHDYATAAIIDVRMNSGGGYDFRMAEVPRRFNDVNRLGCYAVARCGPSHDDLAYVPHLVRSRTDWFDGPVAVLVGEYAGHVTEEFACMVDELPNATIIGDTTRGQVSETTHRLLPGIWRFAMPDSTLLRADSTWVQGVGVAPDIYVEAGPDDFAAGIDPVLEYALDWARSQ